MGFEDADVECMAGGLLDHSFKGLEKQSERLHKAYKKRKVTKRRLAKLLLKFEDLAKYDKREFHSTARLVAQQKMFEFEKELAKD